MLPRLQPQPKLLQSSRRKLVHSTKARTISLLKIKLRAIRLAFKRAIKQGISQQAIRRAVRQRMTKQAIRPMFPKIKRAIRPMFPIRPQHR